MILCPEIVKSNLDENSMDLHGGDYIEAIEGT